MNSKKTPRKIPKRSSQKPSDPLPNKTPYKFLRRTLKIQNDIILPFQQICIKGLYLKNLSDDRGRGLTTREIVYRPFKNNKLFKALNKVQISCLSRFYSQETLKHSKNLKNFRLSCFNDETKMEKIPISLKRLPVHLQSLRLDVVKRGSVVNQNFYNIAKTIRRFRKLEYFHRWYLLNTDRKPNHVSKEIRIYSESVSRLKNIHMTMF